MNALVLMAQAESSGQIEQIARTFGVDWPHLIAQMISFCIMCFLLYRFAYGPVLQMLANRRRLIAESLANADKVKAELARTETQRKEVMAQANAQATQFIEEARAAADVLLKQETKKAIAAAEEIMLKAHQAAAQDHARMLAELKQEVGRLVVHTTSAV
ncbi:MAG TPA: ATP synthase F0 subunit B, partial [Blastocatellia bacterium]|nr:ATP synthase F0 subunit B [Blastocatellia bacterium]